MSFINQYLADINRPKDNCGFGLIAHMKGETSHHLLETAISSLTCMTHRGAIAVDGKTGDGCGILMQKPDTFLRDIAKEIFDTPLSDHYGIGMVFLNSDPKHAKAARDVLAGCLKEQSLQAIGWRDVPVNQQVLGEIAASNVPVIEQVFVNAPNIDSSDLARRLFVARRKAEIALAHDSQFYICSLSNSVISYKGLVMPEDLPKFYLDLSNAKLKTAICVFHQRFSTNTSPQWSLAQPFRLLAHNGEINTICGNRNWSVARTNKFKTPLLPDIDSIKPLVNRDGSDSSSLDNMLEVLISGGMDLFRALRMVVPPAWQNVETMDADLRAFYEYNSMHMEPWDGPAGIVLTEGRYAVCLLDRNGLRPARWVITKNGYITLASEIGVYRHEPEDVVKKGRVGPGEIFAIDTQTGELLTAESIDNQLKTAQPYQEWLYKKAFRIESTLSEELDAVETFDQYTLKAHMKLFQASSEECDQILRPLAESGQEAVGSMGDDTPMAVLSTNTRSLYDYFRQQFAQVTNPPIDPLREAVVMSLETCLGAECNVFEETAEHANRVILISPILDASKFNKLLTINRSGFDSIQLELNVDPAVGLKQAIINLTHQAEQAVKANKTLLILSDRNISPGSIPIPAAMATGAVHHHLVEKGLRCDTNLIIETGSARDPHHFAVLFGFGATAVHPYLSYEIIQAMINSGEILLDPVEAFRNYRKGINKGLLKILSKMGISTIASYRGAQLFEAVGIDSDIVDLCFRGVTSRIAGANFGHFEQEQLSLSQSAWSKRKSVSQGGLLKFVHGGEYHSFNPDVVMQLQQAVQSGDYAIYQNYAKLVNERPIATLRDLFVFNHPNKPIPLDEVEPIEDIISRFDTAGMSLGALSPEAHEALAVAMNRMGARSNSGEGGEDPARYGTEKSSKIKQIASGRFGVTPHYLVNADVLQIKIAQGAKPGEGGQLPGGKVNELIARLRYSIPGVTLISPPPHHDIYSIEDLAQLIFDLKQVNPDALVSVKLVSEPGVGTIAAGVAKAYADLITISGYDGGTAASPLTSIRHAGSPWEIGLTEAHQVLRLNGLRGKIRLQTDGGLKTGLDVIKAAMLGAESFGFGTTPMVALGCKYLRICHLNNCATGVATQNQQLRDEHFIGTVEMVMNFFHFIATETRELLAQLGVKRLADIIGHTDLIKVTQGNTDKHKHIDLRTITMVPDGLDSQPNYCQVNQNQPFDQGKLAEKMVADSLSAIESKSGGEFKFAVTNCDRSIGARISGEIAKRHGNQGMADSPITFSLNGTAGQSFGVWNAGGLHLILEGDANDYVGKGMAGGKIVIKLPFGMSIKSQDTPIMGNTCLYGATGGELYAAGTAGERFAVRNSGAVAVVEGAGDHCCEYMTGGHVTVLGSTGYNFGAGMTGGFAYVLDLNRTFVDKCNHELIEICRINNESMEGYRSHLRGVIQAHAGETRSEWGLHILRYLPNYINQFWLVKPKAASLSQLLDTVTKRPE